MTYFHNWKHDTDEKNNRMEIVKYQNNQQQGLIGTNMDQKEELNLNAWHLGQVPNYVSCILE